MGMVYKRMDFRREWYTKKIINIRQEWYTKGWISDGSGIQKDRFQTGVVYKRMDFKQDHILYYI